MGETPRILIIGSGEEYGYIRKEDVPISEKTPLYPGNLYTAIKLSTVKIKIEIDKSKLCLVDILIIAVNINKLMEITGWKRKYELINTLKETLEY